jgi:hypothetical protein
MDRDKKPLVKNHYYLIENGPAQYIGKDLKTDLHAFEWQNAVKETFIVKRREEWLNEHPPRHIGANDERVYHKMITRSHKNRTKSHNKKGLGGKTKKARGGSPSPPDKKKPLRGVGFSEMRKKNTRSRRKKNQHK